MIVIRLMVYKSVVCPGLLRTHYSLPFHCGYRSLIEKDSFYKY